MLRYPSTWDLAGFITVRKSQLLVTNQNTYAVFQANDELFEKTGKKGKGRPSSRPLPWKKRTAGWYVLFTNLVSQIQKGPTANTVSYFTRWWGI